VKEKDYTKQTRAYTRSHGIVLEVYPKDQNVIIENTHQLITPPPENRLIQAIESLIDLVTYLARQGPHSSVLVRKIHGVCLAKNINCGSEWLMILC
jgi:hypothetical protein